MTDVRDTPSLIDAAQKAVGDGDYLTAERLLREAAAVQEVSLGASHPDLASTLNNLAFVYERTNKIDDAERGYRRAHAIAVASLSPGHPLIATSLKNLVEFCAAHEIPIWKPPATRPDDEEPLFDAEDEQSDGVASQQPEVAIAPDVQHVHVPVAVTSRLTPRTIAVAAVGIAVIVAVLFARQGQGTTDTPRPLPQPQQESLPNVQPAPAETTPVVPRESPPAVARERRLSTTNAEVTVLTAQLCNALEKRGSPDWQCTPITGDQRPGTYFFYTRLLANAATTVEHRWYHGERVHQAMRLRVSASPGSGYRTFSSNTVSAERAGDWKVELRAADGSLLQDVRFVVR